MSELLAPHQREAIVGRAEDEARLRAALAEGVLSSGWLITGPGGAGKATLAYRLVRAALDPAALRDRSTLQMPATARTFRLIANRAHPDLFVAERKYDEKKNAYQTEITVDTIRDLNAFLNKTASFGGWRAAIVDAADDLNKQASNALLKTLEEPPPRTLMLLVANAPGRLLATIRSRCRRIDLKPVSRAQIAALLAAELGVSGDEAAPILTAAKGRPGRALTLAAGEGAEAVRAVGAFLAAASSSGDTARIAQSLSGRQAAYKWETFREVLLESMTDAARDAVHGKSASGRFSAIAPDAIEGAYARIATLFARGDAVNLDRAQMLAAAARTLNSLFSDRAA